MSSPLVSIISPCYNGELYIQRFIESVLNQTYSNIELILINDGSSDNTEIIINSNKTKFENKGIKLVSLLQSNQGQCEAINQGLKYFKGDYLMWVDSDDILFPENIKCKVEFLENNLNCGIVVCKTEIVKENNINKRTGILQRDRTKSKDNFFEDLILSRNVYLMPGGYMVRSSILRMAIPDLTIYSSKILGQNYQMLLPVAYHSKVGYIDEVLFTYVYRNNSHSKRLNAEDKAEKYNDELERMLRFTLKRILNEEDVEYYLYTVLKKAMAKRRLKTAIEYNNRNHIKRYVTELISLNEFSWTFKIYVLIRSKIRNKLLIRILNKIIRY